MIRNIVDVKANDDFTLECEMETGEVLSIRYVLH